MQHIYVACLNTSGYPWSDLNFQLPLIFRLQVGLTDRFGPRNPLNIPHVFFCSGAKALSPGRVSSLGSSENYVFFFFIFTEVQFQSITWRTLKLTVLYLQIPHKHMAVFPLTVTDTISLSALLFQQYKKLQRITVSHSTDTSDRPFKDSLGFSA